MLRGRWGIRGQGGRQLLVQFAEVDPQRCRPRWVWGTGQVWTFTSRTSVGTSSPTAKTVGAAVGVAR